MSFPVMFPRTNGESPLELDEWDRIILGGYVLPGIAALVSGAVKLKLDAKEKAGGHGGKSTSHGLAAQEFAIKVEVWTDAQLERLDEICKAVLPIPRAELTKAQIKKGDENYPPISFGCPSVALLRAVSSVIVVGASALTRSSLGGREMTITLKHWLPSKAKATTTPSRERKIANKLTPQGANPSPASKPGTAAP